MIGNQGVFKLLWNDRDTLYKDFIWWDKIAVYMSIIYDTRELREYDIYNIYCTKN